MAVTVSIYDHAAKLFANKEITFSTLKVKLLNDSASFNATHTQLAQVDNAGAHEVSGNGWPAGGQTIASVAVTQVGTNDARLDGNDIAVTAVGGAIGPAHKAVIYDDSTTSPADAPLFFIDFGGAETAGAGTDFRMTWSASGIAEWTVP